MRLAQRGTKSRSSCVVMFQVCLGLLFVAKAMVLINVSVYDTENCQTLLPWTAAKLHLHTEPGSGCTDLRHNVVLRLLTLNHCVSLNDAQRKHFSGTGHLRVCTFVQTLSPFFHRRGCVRDYAYACCQDSTSE